MRRQRTEGSAMRYLEAFFQDVRYAIRALLRTPIFSLTALAALAIGIGANTAIFSVVDTVLLKPLPYPDADRIVFFFVSTPSGPSYGGSATKFNALRRQAELFEDIAAAEYQGAALNLTGGAYSEQVRSIRVSADYFHLFGVPFVHGRGFVADEDRPGGDRVAILSYRLWQRHFGGAANTVGKTISLGGMPYTVVGIADATFATELNSPPDIWLPFQISAASTDHSHYFTVMARLKFGVTLDAANSQLQLATAEFARRFPNIMGPRDRFAALPLQDGIVTDVRLSLLVLAGAVSFVLLIACANVANLLLARAAGRRHEIAVRAAIGAGRGRIIRQLLTESILLSFIGGVLGLGLGHTGVRLLLAVNPGNIPRIGGDSSSIVMDWRLLVFTGTVSLITGILFGLIPALQMSGENLSSALKAATQRFGGSYRQNKAQALLVIGETALALVLLIGTALMIRTFFALRTVDLGFDPQNILTMRMSLAGTRFKTTSDVNQLVREGLRRLEATSGIVSAGASYSLPPGGAFGIPFSIVGKAPANGRYDGRGWIAASPSYFEVFKIPILRGRAFNKGDDAGTEPVAIISDAMARRFWSKGNPLGERIIIGRGYGPEFEEPTRTIVGVVGDVHDFGIKGSPGPIVYVPMAQITDGVTLLTTQISSLAWVARTRVAPHSFRSPMEHELRRASGGLPVANIRSMKEIVSHSTANADFTTTLVAIFGCSALLLAAIGIYGVMAYTVRQRTQEFGIRMALGADSSNIRNMIVVQGMRLASIGIAIGIFAALGLTRAIDSFLYGVNPQDPVIFIGVPAFLGIVALISVLVPACRATQTDPITALRCE